MATETKQVSTARRSRGQHRYIAEQLVDDLKRKVDLLLGSADGYTLPQVIGLEARLGSAQNAVDKFGLAVSECFELEDTDEDDLYEDVHFKLHCSLLTTMSDISSNLSTIRAQAELSGSFVPSQTSAHGNDRRPTRINTALKPEELQADGTLADFKVWRTGFDDFYASNRMDKFPHREQRAYLRGCLDMKVIQIMEQLLDVDDSMDVVSVLNVLQKHYEDTLSVMTRRVAFHRCVQKPGELFSNFFVRLKLLGSNAELDGMSYEDQLATHIVVAVNDKELQKDLLKIENPDLSNIKTKCLAWETADANQQVLRGDSNTSRLNKTVLSNKKEGRPFDARGRSRDRSKGRSVKSSIQTSKCSRCGWKKHPYGNCPASDKTCHGCGKLGHFRPMCTSKKINNDTKSDDRFVAKTNTVRVCVTQNHIGRSTPLADVTFHLESGVKVQMTVLPDTGATDSIVSALLMKQKGVEVDTTRKCRIVAANGSRMRCFGVVELRAEWAGRKANVTAYVSPDTREFILSWHDMIALGMIPESFPLPKSNFSQTCKVLKAVNFAVECGEDPNTKSIELWKNQIISDFADVFNSTSSFKPMSGAPMHIHLKDMGDERPTHVTTARPISYAYQDDAKKELDYMDKMDVTEDADEPSEWVSPFLVVPKPNGQGVRIVIDYRGLNRFVRRPEHPFPSPAEIKASIPPKAKWFAKLDATKGYWQIPLDDESKKLTTFMTPWGRKRFKRAPMGLASSGDEYCLRGDRALEGIPNLKKVVDDILCYGESFEELAEILNKVMQRCRDHQITLAPHKFEVGSEVEFVGYLIGRDGVRADPSKVDAISKFPTPSNISELRSFYGMVNQLASFSPQIAMVSAPLRGLLSTKNQFQWLHEHEEAFEKTKQELSSPPVLAHYDPKLATKLLTDASKLYGLGYALTQEHPEGWRIVQCGSRYLSDAETRYATCEIELLAVQWAIHKCRLYLLGRDHFVVVTDHKPLLGIVKGSNLDAIDNPRIQRIIEKLSPYVFTMEWVKGKMHCIADALSRAPVGKPEEDLDIPIRSIVVSCISVIDNNNEPTQTISRTTGLLRKMAYEDESYSQLYNAVRNGRSIEQLPVDHPGHLYRKEWDYLSVDGNGLVLLDSSRIIVPTKARKLILDRLHLAHQGIVRTKARARGTIFWHGMMNEIVQMINSCEKCQMYRSSQGKEPLISTEPTVFPFQSASTDMFEFCGAHFLVYVDRYSGWPLVASYRNCPTTRQVSTNLRSFFTLFGIPFTLRSDSGPQFRSEEFKEFCSEFDIDHVVSSAHYPVSNGHAESAVKAMKDLIKKNWRPSGVLDQSGFDKAILEWRNTPRDDGLSPAEWLFGRGLRTLLPVHPESLKRLDDFRLLKAESRRAEKAENKKIYYDSSSKSLPTLKIGTHVRIQDPKFKTWGKIGIIKSIRKNKRSYVIESNGKEYLRNRRFLKLLHDSKESKDCNAVENEMKANDQNPRRSKRVRHSPDWYKT